jgi:heme a synthase
VLLLQGGVGYLQYFTGVPEALVAAHMLGSALMWIAVVRLALSLRERPLTDAGIPDRTDSALSGV